MLEGGGHVAEALNKMVDGCGRDVSSDYDGVYSLDTPVNALGVMVSHL